MPLPLGHMAIGLLTHEVTEAQPPASERLKWLFIITVLANLPDTDVIIGLLVDGNGSLFHRGPTHSLLFALVAGHLVSMVSQYWRLLPRIRFRTAFAVIFSHVLADALFTSSPVSFLWPLELHWSTGYSNLTDVLHSVIFDGFRDLGLVLGSGLLVVLMRLVRGRSVERRQPWARMRS